jgi:lipid A 4'-phosphatase
MKKQILLDFVIPVLVLISLTIVFWSTNLDIIIEEYFYSPEKGWFLKKANPWNFLYDYGSIPAFTLGILSVLVIGISFLSHRVLRYRKIAIFLVLVLVIGPGLVSNAIFKKNWGRPRPRQIVNFGGTENFLPVWVKGVSGKGKSFPSGHASIGYFMFSPFFFLRRINKKWAVLFLLSGITYGTLMGTGRMIQGGHFASDVLWAGGFTYLTGLIIYYVFRFHKRAWWGMFHR